MIFIYNPGREAGEASISLEPLGIVYMFAVIFLTFFLSLGISLFTSISTIKYRDLKNISELGFAIFYWATPIFYSVDEGIGGDKISKMIKLNPLGIMINQFRASMNVYGEIDIWIFLGFTLLTIILLITGWKYFNIKVKKIAEYF
ncbi:MAG: ABC transporter permease [Candidatus Dojkabacteria bacterium]|nr:ABC transporter permease [Candidatus Dojkabacteria bacterium]